jgi:hypothetical protein
MSFTIPYSVYLTALVNNDFNNANQDVGTCVTGTEWTAVSSIQFYIVIMIISKDVSLYLSI